MRRIILVRHGESWGNVDPLAYGRIGDPDIPLTEEGWRQVLRMGDFLENFYQCHPLEGRNYPQAVDSSPWIRAVQTEEACTRHFAGNQNIRFRRLEALKEQSFGLLYRQYTRCDSRLAAKLRAAARQYARNPFEAIPPEGESPYMHSIRVRSLVQDMRHENDITDRLIVAHGATNRHIVLDELGLPPQAWKDIENQNNGDVWILEIDGDDRKFRKIFDGIAGQPVDIDLMSQIKQAESKMRLSGFMSAPSGP